MFPPAFIELLESLGIDPSKDGEIYHAGRLAPGEHVYGGWYHFVGALHITGDFPVVSLGEHFTVWMRQRGSPCLKSLEGLPLVEVEFSATAVPWLLKEAEPV